MDPNHNTPAYIPETISSFELLFTGQNCKPLDKIIKSSRGESMILRMLSLHDGTLKPSRMAELMGTTKGRISSILNSLEAKGLVSRCIDKNNRRSIIVRLTDDGQKCVEEECRKTRNFMGEVFEEMGESDSREFVRLLDRFLVLVNEHIQEDQ